MSASLKTLQRLHDLAIDACKQRVSDLVGEGRRLEAAAIALEAQAKAEMLAGQNDPLAIPVLGAYLQAVRTQLQDLANQRAAIATLEESAREELAAAFLEEKKVEILIEAAEAREATAQSAAEAAMMDELAITRARNK
jgi:flagellar export protein FliJ